MVYMMFVCISARLPDPLDATAETERERERGGERERGRERERGSQWDPKANHSIATLCGWAGQWPEMA